MDIMLYAEINLFSIAVLLIIIFKLSISEMDMSFRRRLFAYSARFVMAANIFDFLWKVGITKYWAVPQTLEIIVNSMYFVCFGFFAYFWFLYVQALVKNDSLENKALLALETIPLAALIILIIVSVFNGCMFYFDEHMVYQRGPLYYLQAILTYGYIGAASLTGLAAMRKKENYVRKSKLSSVVAFAFPLLICGIIQLFARDVPVMTFGISISFMLVYLESVHGLVSVDALTNISNRRELLRYLHEKKPTIDESESLYFLFMDIDSFKRVNDLYGHREGDRAIKTVAEVLKEVCKKTDGFCARYGGDEFALVLILNHDEDIDDILKDINERLEVKNAELSLAYNLGVSIGYSVYPEQAKSLEELISWADKYMYSMKTKKKAM